MRILAFESQPTKFAGGQERSLHEVCSGLAARGFNLGLGYVLPGELLEDYDEFCCMTVQIKSRSLKIPRLPEFVSDLARGVLYNRRWHWDILYANQVSDLPFVATLGRLTRTPVVCHLRRTAHGCLSRQFRWGLQNCARLIANSHFTAETYVNEGIESEHITVVHNGIDPEYFHYQVAPAGRSKTHSPELLYVGRIAPGKGIETLIAAFAGIVPQEPKARLRIVGDVWGGVIPKDYLETLKASCGNLIDRQIVFQPHVADIRPLLAGSDLLLMPSNCGEAFGRVLIEAMASGVPTIASRDGGIPEILLPDFADHLTPAGDAGALRAALLRHMHWRQDDPQLGLRCRRWVQSRFSLNKSLVEIEQVFRQTLD